MFHHPAWAVGSYSSGHQPGELPKTKSTQPSRRPPESPCNTRLQLAGVPLLELEVVGADVDADGADEGVLGPPATDQLLQQARLAHPGVTHHHQLEGAGRQVTRGGGPESYTVQGDTSAGEHGLG